MKWVIGSCTVRAVAASGKGNMDSWNSIPGCRVVELDPLQQRTRKPDDLLTAREAAARLGFGVKTLDGHRKSGAIRYIITGHGTKRPRKRFAPADIDAFIDSQRRKETPCPSTVPRARLTGTSISSGEVIAFTAVPRPRPGAKPKK